jgi:prepilin-type N-terminal cleavage/methylation domain-containing protein
MLTRRGFTLIEMVAALAIFAIVAAVLVPALLGRLDKGESGALITNLDSLGEAIAAYRSDVGFYPRQLAYLSTPIPTGTQDLCGNTIAAANLALWRGPYLDRAISTAGLPSGGSLIGNTITRDPASGATTVANLVISISEVDQSEASDVDAQLDGDGNLGTGGVRWSVGAFAGRGTLTYRIPIRGC